MHRESMEAYKQAIRIKPDDAKAHYNLGLVYLILNDRNSALDFYKKLKTLNPEMANRLFNLIYK
ncbi:MAG: tetratricopeptide repeat protein [Proteobacteria bacterium]|nr:tetratricopeptide repeat protein [Pseudomonadota bacterium]